MMRKKLLAIGLILSILFSYGAVPMITGAAEGVAHEEEVSKLNVFGILSGYPSADYKADAEVSAKDFVAAAYRTAGKSESGVYVQTAAQKFGFSAEDKSITLRNAAGVLIDALDYTMFAVQEGGWPNGYWSVAATKHLVTGMGKQADDKVTNDMMAVMLYRALSLDMVKIIYSPNNPTYSYDKDKTFLNNLDIYEGEGIVTATQYTALAGSSRASGGEIRINNENSYSVGRTYADELLGFDTEFYYNKENELLWIDASDKTSVIKVAEVDINELTTEQVKYYDEKDNLKTAMFDTEVTFVYNGERIDVSSNEDLQQMSPRSGYLTLVDNNRDRKYDAVLCEAYDYYLVSGKNDYDYVIADYEAGTQISLDPDDYDRVNIIKSGKKIGFADIAENDVIAAVVPKTAKGKLKVFVVDAAPIAGSITYNSGDEVQIDKTKYEISTSYEGAALSIEKVGTFYLDLNGHIVRFTKGSDTISKYGYVITIYPDDSGDDYFVKLLTAGGTVEEYAVSGDVRLNSTKINPRVLYNKFTETGTVKRQLVNYALNSDGKIRKIEFADEDNLDTGKDQASDEFSLYFSGHGRFRKNNLSFNSKYLIEANTPIFIIPSSREMKDYEVRTASTLNNGTSYYISIYDIDEYMTAGAIVLDETSSDPEQLKAKRSILVEKVSMIANNDGDIAYQLTGWQNGAQVTLKTEDDTIIKDAEGRAYSIGRDLTGTYQQIKAGDIIQTSIDNDGYLLAFRTLYKADAAKKKLVISDSMTPNEYEEGGSVDEFADLFILTGTVVSRSANILVVRSDMKRAHKITNGAAVYMVDGKNVRKVTTSDIKAYDQVYVHTYQGNLQEVVIYR